MVNPQDFQLVADLFLMKKCKSSGVTIDFQSLTMGTSQSSEQEIGVSK